MQLEIVYSVSVSDSVSVSVIPFPFPGSGFRVLVLPSIRTGTRDCLGQTETDHDFEKFKPAYWCKIVTKEGGKK